MCITRSQKFLQKYRNEEKSDILIQSMVQSMDKQCDCGLAAIHMSLHQLECLQPNMVVLSGVLVSSKRASCRVILELVQDWVKNGSVIRVEGVPLMAVRECPVLSKAHEKACCKISVSPTTVKPTPISSGSPTKSILEHVLLPVIVSVLVVVLLGIVIMMTCIVIIKVRNKKGSETYVRMCDLSHIPTSHEQ